MNYRYEPANKLPKLDRQDLASNSCGAFTEGNERVRRFFRFAPEFIDDPESCGIFEGLGSDIYRSPQVFVTATDQATLTGYRTMLSDGNFSDDEILLGGDHAIQAYLDKMASPDPFANEQTGLRRVENDLFELDKMGRVERHIPGTTVVLCSHEPSNYGSLIFRVLPKLITLRNLGLLDLPMIAWAWHANYQRLLQLGGLEPEKLIQHDVNAITHLDRAIVPSLRNPNAYLDRESHTFMQQLADRFDHPPFGRRIYISRLRHGKISGSTRVMLNEDVLASRLASLNFEIIEPEQLSVEEQIATFASADMVVGPSGSAMFNTVFCRPGTKIVDIESEPHWIYAHAGLFASCGLRYGLFVGKPDAADTRPVHRMWTVNVERLMQRLDLFIRA